MTACLGGAVKLARRQHGEKKSAVVDFAHFLLLFLYNTYVCCAERDASAVENLGSPRY